MPADRVPIVAALNRGVQHTGILEGISQHARTRPDWDLLVVDAPIREMIYYIRDLKPRGVITCSSQSNEIALLKTACDLVINTIEVEEPETETVCPDNKAIGRLAAERLLALRSTALAYVATHMEGDDPIRWEGFRSAGVAAGLPVHLVRAQSVYDHTRRNLVRNDIAAQLSLLRGGEVNRAGVPGGPGFIGVMAFSDWVGFHVLRALQDAEMRVPGEFLVIGVDNDPVFSTLCRPRLTSVDPGYQAIGRESAAYLERCLGPRPPKERIVRIAPAGIVERESSEAVGPEDSELFRALAFLRDHALVPTTPEQVADQVGRSRRWLDMRLIDKIGRTAAAEIERLRMEHAIRLLRDPHMALSDIATACGYKTLSNYCRAFRAARGVTPTQWRRSHGV